MKLRRRWPCPVRCAALLLGAVAVPVGAAGGGAARTWAGDAVALMQRSSQLEAAAAGADKGAAKAAHLGRRGASAKWSEEEDLQLDTQVVTAGTIQALGRTLRHVTSMFRAEIEAFQEEQERELSSIQGFHTYLDQLLATFGRKETLFGELMGMVPVGRATEADRNMTTQLLQAFRSREFVKAVKRGMDAMSLECRSLVWRTEKHFGDLMKLSASGGDTQEVQGMLREFFRKEHHVLLTLLDTVSNALQALVGAAPQTPSLKAVSSDILNKLLTTAYGGLNRTMAGIIRSNGTMICGESNLDIIILEQAIPYLNRTARALPKLEAMVAAEVPDLALQVVETTEWFRENTQMLVDSLGREAKGWIEKVCGLVGASNNLS